MNATLFVALAAAALPTVAVLIGILVNRTDAACLSGELLGLRAEMHAHVYSLSSKIDSTRTQLHSDIVMLPNIGRKQNARIVRLESRL